MFILKNEKNLMQSLKFMTTCVMKAADVVVVDVVVFRAAGIFTCARLVLLTLLDYFSP